MQCLLLNVHGLIYLTVLLLCCFAYHSACNFKHFTAPVCVARDIADCAKEFQSRKLPLHGLINNIGVENPHDIKSKDGFDVCPTSCYMLSAWMLLCCSIPPRTWPAAAYTSIQLFGALLPNSPLAGEADGDTTIKDSQPHFIGGT